MNSALILALAMSGADCCEAKKVQWVVFTVAGCGPCKRDRDDYEPAFKKSNWKLGEELDCHIRFIDAGVVGFEFHEYDIKYAPQYMLIVEGEPVERHWRYPGWKRMAEAYNQEVKRLNK